MEHEDISRQTGENVVAIIAKWQIRCLQNLVTCRVAKLLMWVVHSYPLDTPRGCKCYYNKASTTNQIRNLCSVDYLANELQLTHQFPDVSVTC